MTTQKEITEIAETLQAVATWAMDAAHERVDLAKHTGDPLDAEPCAGLWQAFQADFDFDTLHAAGTLDAAISMWSRTYTDAVKLFAAE